MLATINVSAQLALPGWVRGRGLSIFGTVMFGGLTFGSALWGQVAAMTDLPLAHFAAAAGAILAIPVLWRWKLQTGAGVDLTPSMHWPEPVLANEVDARSRTGAGHGRVSGRDAGSWRLPCRHRQARTTSRRRDGAFDWGLFEDAAEPGRFLETFLLDSWIEHLRQHERVTEADRALQDAVHRLQLEGAPKVTHLIAVEMGDAADRQGAVSLSHRPRE